MSASIIPPLPDPLPFFRLTSISFVSLTPYGGGPLLDSLPPVGGFNPLSLLSLSDSVVQRVSIPLSIFPVFFSRPPSRTSIESFLPAEPTGHTARLFSSHLLCKRTQSRPVTLSLLLLLLLLR